MLKIRLSRVGRKGVPFYRIVLTEHKRSAKHGYLKVLGFYNPITKDFKIDDMEAEKHISNGAQYSQTLQKILERKGLKK